MGNMNTPFTAKTRGGTPCRPVRCFECQLPGDLRVADFADGKATCSVCGRTGYGKYNETGHMFK